MNVDPTISRTEQLKQALIYDMLLNSPPILQDMAIVEHYSICMTLTLQTRQMIKHLKHLRYLEHLEQSRGMIDVDSIKNLEYIISSNVRKIKESCRNNLGISLEWTRGNLNT